MVEVGLVRVGAGTGGCFMIIGSADGRDVPCSLSLMSFIAMENSNLSIFPSLFMSASALRDGGETDQSVPKEANHRSSKVEKLVKICVCVCLSHHISANTEAGSPDWRKNFLACSPAERERKRKMKLKQLMGV